MFEGVFLYDHLDSGHCSADHVLLDSARFGCRSFSSWHVVLMALLLQGARAEKGRFQIFRPWGIARAHFFKKGSWVRNSRILKNNYGGETIY